MLYNLNTVIAHSAKGTTWTKHKYIKKVNGRYYYPKTSNATKKTNGKEFITKVGSRWYNLDEINADRAKMDAADEYNQAMKNAGGVRDEIAANTAYNNTVANAIAYENASNNNLSLKTNVTKGVLNAGESAKEFLSKAGNAINDGKEAVSRLFSGLKIKKKTKKVDTQAKKQQAIDKQVIHKPKFNKDSYQLKRIGDKINYTYNKIAKNQNKKQEAWRRSW